MGFSGSSAGKESTYNVGDLGSIPGLGRSLGEGNGYPFHYSGLENSMDCISMGSQSRTRLSDFHLGSPRGDRCSVRVTRLDQFTEGIPTEPRSFSFPLWAVRTQETLAHRRRQCGKGAPGRGEDGEGSPQALSPPPSLSFVH